MRHPGIGPGEAKVSLATASYWAYDEPCLVNRLWVPIAVRPNYFSKGSKLHGNSQISADFSGFHAPVQLPDR
jgi:hypothetical protein